MTREVRSLESRLDNKYQENSKIQSRLDWYLFKERNEKEEKKRGVYVCSNSQMSYSMKNEAIATVKKYFDLYDSNCWRVEHIRKHFDDKYGKCWHCIIGKYLQTKIYHTSNNYITLTIGNYDVELYKCG